MVGEIVRGGHPSGTAVFTGVGKTGERLFDTLRARVERPRGDSHDLGCPPASHDATEATEATEPAYARFPFCTVCSVLSCASPFPITIFRGCGKAAFGTRTFNTP